MMDNYLQELPYCKKFYNTFILELVNLIFLRIVLSLSVTYLKMINIFVFKVSVIVMYTCIALYFELLYKMSLRHESRLMYFHD